MDKARVWSSLPAWSRVNVTTAGSGMVVEDKTARTQVVKGETVQSQTRVVKPVKDEPTTTGIQHRRARRVLHLHQVLYLQS